MRQNRRVASPDTGGMPLSINPATGESVGTHPFLTDPEIEAALVRATRANLTWSAMSCAERAVPMRAAAALLRAAKNDLARSITLEMGKPLSEAEGEIDKSAWNCEYVAERAEQWLADEVVQTEAKQSYISYLPVGTVL